jgi:hypothetical protein
MIKWQLEVSGHQNNLILLKIFLSMHDEFNNIEDQYLLF